MAAALTNLGNLVYRQGELHEAKSLYDRALKHDPAQPEARYDVIGTHAARTRLQIDRDAATRWSHDTQWLGLEILAGADGGTTDDECTVELIVRGTTCGTPFA